VEELHRIMQGKSLVGPVVVPLLELNKGVCLSALPQLAADGQRLAKCCDLCIALSTGATNARDGGIAASRAETAPKEAVMTTTAVSNLNASLGAALCAGCCCTASHVGFP